MSALRVLRSSLLSLPLTLFTTCMCQLLAMYVFSVLPYLDNPLTSQHYDLQVIAKLQCIGLIQICKQLTQKPDNARHGSNSLARLNLQISLLSAFSSMPTMYAVQTLIWTLGT